MFFSGSGVVKVGSFVVLLLVHVGLLLAKAVEHRRKPGQPTTPTFLSTTRELSVKLSTTPALLPNGSLLFQFFVCLVPFKVTFCPAFSRKRHPPTLAK